MIGHRILHVEDARLTAYRRQSGDWLGEEAFPRTEAGSARFAAYLQAHRRSRFRLLADISRETLLLEQVPRLRGRDRRALIERRLAQAFPNVLLRLATPLGTAKAPRKHEQWSLSALDDGTILAPWLDRIAASGTHLSGIYSISQLLGTVLGQLAETPSQCLVFLPDTGLLRQAFLVNGMPHLFRTMSDFPDDTDGLASEAGRVQHYLYNQHHLPRGTATPLFILTADELVLPNGQRQALPTQRTRTTLFLDALASTPPRLQFADRRLCHAARQARLRRAAGGLATLLALATWPVIADNLSRTRQMAADIATRQGDAIRLQQHLSRQPAATDGWTVERLRRLSASYDELIRQQRDPRHAWHELSRILDRHPEVWLEALDWEAENDDERLRLQGTTSGDFTQFVAALHVDRKRRVDIVRAPEATGDFTIELRTVP